MSLDSDRVQDVFLAALERSSPDDRAAVLDVECGDDVELRRRVEALLIAHDKPDGLFDRPFLLSGKRAEAVRVRPTGATDEVGPHPNGPGPTP